MGYPIWDLAIGGGMLLAIVAIEHVIVSHFAIGDGLLIVVTETLAILVGIGLLMMLAWVSNPVEKPGLVTGTLSAMTLTIAVMNITCQRGGRSVVGQPPGSLKGLFGVPFCLLLFVYNLYTIFSWGTESNPGRLRSPPPPSRCIAL